jgi:hypothetical protein
MIVPFSISVAPITTHSRILLRLWGRPWRPTIRQSIDCIFPDTDDEILREDATLDTGLDQVTKLVFRKIKWAWNEIATRPIGESDFFLPAVVNEKTFNPLIVLVGKRVNICVACHVFYSVSFLQ